jgi:Tol biopolymer transport system component
MNWRFLVSGGDFLYSRPCFSPDGCTVLYMRSPKAPPAEQSWSFWTVPVAGGKPSLFFSDPELQATRPDWCWQTNQIVFTGYGPNAPNPTHLWLIDGDGKNLTPVGTGDPATQQLSYPSWYPDGCHVAVTNYADNQLLQVDTKTGSQSPLTDPGSVLAGMCSVSAAAGNPLAFAGQPPGKGPYNQNVNHIWLQQGAGAPPYQLDGEQGRSPWFSPDGSHVAFATGRDGHQDAYFLLIEPWHPSGDDPVSIVEAAPGLFGADHPKWSPDGSMLTFYTYDGTSGIAVADVPPLG